MSIKFECPKCKKQLEAENDHIGMMLECPQCNEELKVPKPALKVASAKDESKLNDDDGKAKAQNKDTKKNPTAKQWLQGCLTFIVIVVIAGSCIKSCGKKSTLEEQAKEKKSAESRKKQIEEIEKMVPEARLNFLLKKELGSLNRKGERVAKISINNNILSVDFSINDSLSSGWIKYGMKADIVKILNCIKTSKFNKYLKVIIHGFFPLVDKYGNSKEEMVLNIVFYKKDIDKINFDNFHGDKVYHLGDNIWLHPAFKFSK